LRRRAGPDDESAAERAAQAQGGAGTLLTLRRFRAGGRRQTRVMAGTLLILLVGGALWLLFWLVEPFQDLQAGLSDTLFQSGETPEGIVIAAIDDRALSTHGGFGDWPGTLHAQAVRNLSAAGARVIVFDLLFVDPSPEDAALGEAFRAAGNVVLAAAGVQPVASDGGEPRFAGLLLPPETLRASAVAVGHVNVAPDADGVLRRFPLVIRDAEGKQYPSIVLSALFAPTLRPVPELSGDGDRVTVLNQRVPVDDALRMRPLYSARLADFRRVSYADAIAGTLPEGSVRGQTVIIGLTAAGSGDVQRTPFGASEPGAVVLGNALDSLRRGEFVREASAFEVALGLLPLIAVTTYAVPRFNVRVTVALLIGLGVANYVFLIALFNSDQRLVMNFVYPALLLPAMFITGLGYRIAAERADRRELGDLFGRYASPEIMQELAEAADRGRLELGSTVREVTCLFADLRGFTGVSERLPPQEVVRFLNSAFEVMIGAVIRNEGVVNKFGGDMIMGIWNAPRDTADHACKAVKAAQEALAEMDRLDLRVPDDPDARFGFGVNTGDVVAGYLGSAGRLEYSVIGDPVNVASRL
jgi:adenylate cyclase